MRYLVEIIHKNGLTPVYKYYNSFTEIRQTISQSDNIEFIEVYTLDKEKTNIVTKMIKENKK